MALRSSAVAFSSGGSITAAPVGVQAHDYLGGQYLVDSDAVTLTQPALWTNDTSNKWFSAAPDGSQQFFAFKADASGSDAFNFTDSGGASANTLQVGAWSGRDNATPHSTARVKTLNTTANATPISATITGITASQDDDIAIWLGTDQTAADGRWTFSTITNYTEQQDGVANNWTSGAGLQTRDDVNAGPTGNFSVTITRGTGTGNAGYAGIVVAIKQGAVVTPVPPPPQVGRQLYVMP